MLGVCFQRCQLPFASDRSAITPVSQQLGVGRHLFEIHPIPGAFVNRENINVPMAVRVKASMHTDPRRRTNATGIGPGKPDTLLCHLIKMRCGEVQPAIATQALIAEIVHIDEQDIGLCLNKMLEIGRPVSYQIR